MDCFRPSQGCSSILMYYCQQLWSYISGTISTNSNWIKVNGTGIFFSNHKADAKMGISQLFWDWFLQIFGNNCSSLATFNLVTIIFSWYWFGHFLSCNVLIRTNLLSHINISGILTFLNKYVTFAHCFDVYLTNINAIILYYLVQCPTTCVN